VLPEKRGCLGSQPVILAYSSAVDSKHVSPTRSPLWRVIPLTLCLIAPSVTRAEESASEPQGYRVLVDEGLREYQAGNFAEARALFGRAHALSPSARTLRGIAMAAFELHQYAECVAHIEAALASQTKPLTGPLRDEAEALRLRAGHFVDRVVLQVAPTTANISVDGQPLVGAPHEPVVLDIGEHDFDFSAEGFTPLRRTVRVRGGEQRVVSASLVPLAVPGREKDRMPTTPVPSTGHSWVRSAWLWSAVGAVVLAGAIAGGLTAAGGGTRSGATYAGNVPTAEGP
jgi:PEGA domain